MENRDGFVFIDCVSIVSNRININTTYHSHNSANWSVDSLFAIPQSVHIQIKRQSPLEGMYCLDLIIELYSKGIYGLAIDNFIFNIPPKVKNNKFCYVIFSKFSMSIYIVDNILTKFRLFR